jgi:hypothetical protein
MTHKMTHKLLENKISRKKLFYVLSYLFIALALICLLFNSFLMDVSSPNIYDIPYTRPRVEAPFLLIFLFILSVFFLILGTFFRKQATKEKEQDRLP